MSGGQIANTSPSARVVVSLSSGLMSVPLTRTKCTSYLVGVRAGVFQQLPELDLIWRLALVTGFLGGTHHFIQLFSRSRGHAAARLLCAGGRHGQLALVRLTGPHGAGT